MGDALRETKVEVLFLCDFDEVNRLDSMVDSTISNVTGNLGNVENELVSLAGNFGDLANDAVSDLNRVENSLSDLASEDATPDIDLSSVAADAVGDLQRVENALEDIGSGNPVRPIEQDLEGLGQETQQTRKSVRELGQEFIDALGSQVETQVEGLTDTVGGLGDKLGTVLGVAGITAGAGAIIGSTNDIEQAMNGLSAQTGITGKELDAMGESMKNLYTNGMGEDFGDIANSMATVNQVLGLTGKELESATNSALVLRDTFDMDVSESMRAVNSLMDNFGVSAEQAYSMIAQGAQNGLNQNDDLLDTINEYSVQFAKLGFSSEDMFNSLASGVENGTWSVDKLGDAVKEFSIRAIDGSDTTIAGFEAIGLNAEQMMSTFAEGGEGATQAFQKVVQGLVAIEDPVQRDLAGVSLFGTMWEDLGVKGIEALANLDGGITSTTDALETINEVKYDDAGSALASLGRTINVELAEEVGGAVEKSKGYITDFTAGIQGAEGSTETAFGRLGNTVSSIGQAVSATASFIVENWNMIAPALTVIIGLYATIKGAILAYNAVCAIQKGLQVAQTVASYAMATAKGVEVSTTTAATAAQLGLNTALLACPLTWIILAIMAVIAVIILVICYFDEIKAVVINVWNKIVEVMSPIATWINENVIQPVVEFFTGLWEKITGVFTSVIGWVKSNWKSIILFIINPFAGIFSYLYNNFEGFRNFIDGIVQSVVGFFTGIANFFVGIATWVYTYIITPIIQIVAKLFEIVYVLVQVGIQYIMNIVITIVSWINTNIITPIVNFFTLLWSQIVAIWNSIVSSIMSIMGTISGWINANVITPLVSFFTGLWEKIKGIFSAVSSFFTSVFRSAYQGIVNIFNGLTSFFSGLWAKIKSLFTSAGQSIADAVSGAFRNSVNAVLGFAESILNGFVSKINGAIGAINKIPGVSISALPTFSIPRLATGGVVDDSTIANIGEAGAEAVVPLENNLGWLDRMANMIVGAMYKQSTYTPEATTSNTTTNDTKTIVVEKGAVTITVEGGSDANGTADKVKQKIEEFFEELRDDNKPVFEY